MEKNKVNKQNDAKTPPARYVLAGVLFLLLLAGTYTFLFQTIESKMLALIGVGSVFVFSLIAFGLACIANKKGKLKKVLKPILIIAVAGVVLVNTYFLNSSYFVPHKTTTSLNRYFPVSLETSVKMQNYLQDKTLYVDPVITFFDWEYHQLSAIGHSYIASVKSSVKQMKTLEEPIGVLSEAQADYLIAQTDAYEMVDWNYYRVINAYFFYDVMESDEAIAVWGRQMHMFFITPETFEQLKEIAQ